MLIAFKQLMEDPKYGGRYYSLTPGIPESISKEKYQVCCRLLKKTGGRTQATTSR